MLRLLRRFLSLCALLFWQGGFTFYTAVVIPIAGSVLEGTHLRGRISAQVFLWLNVAGVATLVLLLWEMASTKGRRGGRFVCWAVMLVTLMGLFGLHYWLRVLDPHPGSGTGAENSSVFWVAHSTYIWVSIVQWLTALVYLALTIRVWRAEDAAPAAGEEKV